MPKDTTFRSQAGFTLIELLVVTVLSILLMLSASAVLGSFLLNGAKTNIEQRIKQDGNLALARMEYVIRNAKALADNGEGTCAPGMGSLAVTSWDDGTTLFEGLDDAGTTKIASSSTGATPTIVYLSSDAYTLTNLTFNCTTTANGSEYVDITFTLKWGTGAQPNRDTAIITFNSGVETRN